MRRFAGLVVAMKILEEAVDIALEIPDEMAVCKAQAARLVLAQKLVLFIAKGQDCLDQSIPSIPQTLNIIQKVMKQTLLAS